MKIISTRKETFHYLAALKMRGRTIGLVPTMGALHEGHLSLVRAAVRETDIAVVSIFVNPTQFGPTEDLDQYPRQEKRDLELLGAAGAHLVFMPTPEEIYPRGYRTYVEVEQLGGKLCGASRPGHFRGVTTVVNLLFHTIRPDRAYFGLKDRQQLIVLRRMVKDFGWPIEMIGMPTVREPDGLALSSRNAYLSSEERAVAPLIQRGLEAAHDAFRSGQTESAALCEIVSRILEREPRFRIDYVQLVNQESLETPMKASAGDFIAVAAFLGNTRLIDNVEL